MKKGHRWCNACKKDRELRLFRTNSGNNIQHRCDECIGKKNAK